MNRTPVSELSTYHQQLIKSWATKKPMPSTLGRGSPLTGRTKQNLENAIAHFLKKRSAPTSLMIARFGHLGGADAVLGAINRLIEKGAIVRDGLWVKG